MNFDQFIRIYGNVLLLKKKSFPMLGILDEMDFHKFNPYYIVPDEENPRQKADFWYHIIDYQLLMLQKYLRCCWRIMLKNSLDQVDAFLFFLYKNPQLVCSMGKELLSFLYEVDKLKQFFHLSEPLLLEKDVEIFLSSHFKEADVQEIFAKLMAFKVQHFDDDKSHAFNYQIFMEWLPKWKDLYPQAWSAVVQELAKMKDKVDFRAKEVQEIYALYA